MNKEKQKHGDPPAIARWLLERRTDLHRSYERMMDLEDLFYMRTETLGPRQARYQYWKDVLSILLRPSLRRSADYERSNFAMLENYVKVAYRNIVRHLGFSLINILGLALGIAACGMILLYVQDELAFDRFHSKADRIYRVVESRESPDLGERHIPATAGPLTIQLAADFPEVENGVRLIRPGRFAARYKDGPRFYEGDYFLTDASFLEIFDFELKEGNRETALKEPFSVVLTESCARKYFGSNTAIGEVLNMDRFGEFKVTGIVADPPHNSHLYFNMLMSLATQMSNENWRNYTSSWKSDQFLTYIQLREGAEVAAMEPLLAGYLSKQLGEDAEVRREIQLQPLPDIHFYSEHVEFDENQHKGNVVYIFVFSTIAFLIALVACINYMNLSTARSVKRSREVGMRKVVGAKRSQLAGQFLSEAILIVLLAFVVALLLINLALPFFNELYDKQISLNVRENWIGIVSILGITLFIGFLSGSYPAAFLSGMKPIATLKGRLSANKGAGQLRKSLVILQFVLSISMIVATVVVYQQLTMFRNQNLGFQQDQLVIVDINSRNARDNFALMKNEFASHSSVKEVSVSSRIPGDWKPITEVEAHRSGDASGLQTMNYISIDEDFLSTYQMTLLAGRNFSGLTAQDSLGVLINEAAVRQLGLENPLGQYIEIPDVSYSGEIIGVVNDFNFRSLHEDVGPMILGFRQNPVRVIDYFTLRVAGKDMTETLAHLEAVHDRIDQGTPIEINFLDEQLRRFYENDVRTGQLVGVAAILTIVVACLGLLGLTAYIAEQRTREVGVRKVLGASTPSIIFLLTHDFTKLIVIAALISIPVSWFALERWLENFAYRIDIGISAFLLAGFAALLVAWLTIGYQAIKTALLNPIHSLRHE